MTVPIPRVSFIRLRKLIEAYYEIKKDIVKTKELNDFLLNTIDYGDISGSVKFFVFLNLLEKQPQSGYYKVTQICKELGLAIGSFDDQKESNILKEIISNNLLLQKINQRISFIAKISGSIKLDDLKKEIIKIFNWEPNRKNYESNALTIIDLFKAAKVIRSNSKSTLIVYNPPKLVEFINSKYIEELIVINSLSKFDLTRLISYCQQINDNYTNNKFESVAFLARAIIHHIPPIFDKPNFQSLTSQIEQGKDSSFKKSCINLQNSLKHIVDDLIHRPIGSSEMPLAEQEINFAQDLNRLIRGIIDKLKSQLTIEKPK